MINVDIAQALLEVALRTRIPSAFGLQLADFWAWLRYFPALDSSRGVRLRPEWGDLDSHQKTILSDDWGVGFSCLILGEFLDVAAWGHTRHVLTLLNPAIATAPRTAKAGPTKSPDFLGLDDNWQFVVLECKGSQTNRGTLRKFMENGQVQKDSISFGASVTVRERLVGGLFVPNANAKEDAQLRVTDPPEVKDIVLDASPEELATVVLQSECAWPLTLAGLPLLGELFTRKNLTRVRRLPAVHREEVLRALNQRTATQGFVGVERVFSLPSATLTTDDGEARRVSARIEVDSALLRDLAEAQNIGKALLGYVERSREATSGHSSVDAEGGKSDSKWRPSYVRQTRTGFRLVVTWTQAAPELPAPKRRT